MAAPSSAKKARKERAPEKPQTRKGHPWSLGRKAHLGVGAKAGLVPRGSGTAANGADLAQTPALRHGQEKEVDGDAGDRSVEKREESATPGAGVAWPVAAQRG